MRRRGLPGHRREVRERKNRHRVGVDELARRAAAGLDLWTGEPAAGAAGAVGSSRRWTAEEDELVRALGAEEAAARTGRSLRAVRARRRELGAPPE